MWTKLARVQNCLDFKWLIFIQCRSHRLRQRAQPLRRSHQANVARQSDRFFQLRGQVQRSQVQHQLSSAAREGFSNAKTLCWTNRTHPYSKDLLYMFFYYSRQLIKVVMCTDKRWQRPLPISFILLPCKICDILSFATQNKQYREIPLVYNFY